MRAPATGPATSRRREPYAPSAEHAVTKAGKLGRCMTVGGPATSGHRKVARLLLSAYPAGGANDAFERWAPRPTPRAHGGIHALDGGHASER